MLFPTLSPTLCTQVKSTAQFYTFFTFLCHSTHSLSLTLYKACATWFPAGTDSSLEGTLKAYSVSKLYSYLWVLVGISVLGIIINLLPAVSNWVEKVSKEAFENNMEAAASEGASANAAPVDCEDTQEEDDSSKA